jgi:ubiquinone/menaquinone biosynthesis C-methylase UbiE
MSNKNIEKNRIVAIYNNRWENDLDKYSIIHHGELLMQYDYEKHLYKIINKSFSSINNLRVLEIGCGTGIRLTDFLRINIPKNQLYGVDLHENSLKWAKENRLDANYFHANASELPFEDSYFDIILFRTVFSSISEDPLCKKICNEALRVCNPQGLIISYDLKMGNPKNSDVRAIKIKWLIDMFGQNTIFSHSLTLLPTLSRLIGKLDHGMLFYSFLSLFPFLRTHQMNVFIKKKMVVGLFCDLT